ncbi:hypothetical protein MBLNU459_g6010t1 [Dothideomycetes sp. NU459]
MICASERGVSRQWLRGLPKCELHLHLEGTVEPDTLVALSQRHDATPLTLEDAKRLYIYEDFRGFLRAFFQVTERLRDAEDYELVTYDMVKRLADQGIRHAEVYISYSNIMRSKPWLKVEDVTAAVEHGRLRAEQECGTTVYWIIDIVRQHELEASALVLRKAIELRSQYPSIVGVGIGGDEAGGPAAGFAELYRQAKAAGLHVKAHAGEAEPSSSIRDAIAIGSERIGHALTAIHDPELLDMLAASQLPLELCVTSNLRTGCCKKLEDHPVRRYFDLGLMVTLNSDDPPMFGANLLDDFETVQRSFGFTGDEMKQFARNSIVSSFLPLDRKNKLLQELEIYPRQS